MTKVRVKSFKEIEKTFDGFNSWSGLKQTDNISFNDLMKDLAGKTIEVFCDEDGDIEDTENGYYWSRKWLTGKIPKYVRPKEYKRGFLIDDYSVEVGVRISIGCQYLSKTQELRWFKLLAKRLGYELQG